LEVLKEVLQVQSPSIIIILGKSSRKFKEGESHRGGARRELA
jgi:hypothetical protein